MFHSLKMQRPSFYSFIAIISPIIETSTVNLYSLLKKNIWHLSSLYDWYYSCLTNNIVIIKVSAAAPFLWWIIVCCVFCNEKLGYYLCWSFCVHKYWNSTETFKLRKERNRHGKYDFSALLWEMLPRNWIVFWYDIFNLLLHASANFTTLHSQLHSDTGRRKPYILFLESSFSKS